MTTTPPRKQKHLVVFQPSGHSGYIEEGKTMTEASRELGVDLEGICGGRSRCGKCKIKIEEGVLPLHKVLHFPILIERVATLGLHLAIASLAVIQFGLLFSPCQATEGPGMNGSPDATA
jgi:hypothetical protein